MSDSKTNGKLNIILILVNIIVAIFFAVTAYAYWCILPKIADNIIENDRRNTTEHLTIINTINAQYHEIIQRLTKIETLVIK